MIFGGDSVKKILAIGAHPDDIEIGCGGAIQKLVQAQKSPLEIRWVVFSGDPTRAAEAKASAERYLQETRSQVQVHQFQDSFFPDQWSQIKTELHTLGQHFDPDLIFTHKLEDRHQDHKTLAELTWNVFRQHTILEYEIPKYEGDLTGNNVFCSLPREMAEQKSDWLHECFVSQVGKPWFDKELFMGLMRLRGTEAPGATRYAEAFTCRKLGF